MNQKEIIENQYGEKRMLIAEKVTFPKIRELLKSFDVDRCFLAAQMITPGDSVLDIGCGDGEMLLRLMGKFNKLAGLDISSSRLTDAQRNIKEKFPLEIGRFKFVEGNADNNIPFPDNHFDTVVCVASLQQIYDIFSIVREMYRVTKPGGYVIAQVPNIAYLKYRVGLLFGRYPETSSPYNWQNVGWDCGVIHFFTLENFCWLFEQQGFVVEKKSGSGFLAYLRNWWPSLLTGDFCIKAVKPK